MTFTDGFTIGIIIGVIITAFFVCLYVAFHHEPGQMYNPKHEKKGKNRDEKADDNQNGTKK